MKALMVDVDGVVVVHPEPGGWATHLERDLGLSKAALQAAFFVLIAIAALSLVFSRGIPNVVAAHAQRESTPREPTS